MKKIFKSLFIISSLILVIGLVTNSCSQVAKLPYAVLKDSTMTFYYGKNKPVGAYDVEEMINDRKPWDSAKEQIKIVVFDQTFKDYRPKSCELWFYMCENLTSIEGIKENLNTSEVTNMSHMFAGCINLRTLDVSGFKTDKVTDMYRMFDACLNLTTLDVSGFKTDKVEDMSSMFNGCTNLTSLDVSGFNTDKVVYMQGMFLLCENLTNLDVSGFNTSIVSSMFRMFCGCKKLICLDLSGFNTESVSDMREMFSGCENLVSLDVRGFNTDGVTKMETMFSGCENLTSLDLSSFNTKNVINMWSMFTNCSKLKTIYVGDGWNTSQIMDEDLFWGCLNLVGGKGTKYDSSVTDKSRAKIDGGESDPGYLTKKE